MRTLGQWRLWLGLLVSVLLLYLAMRGLNLHALLQALQGASYWYTVPALASYFAGVYVRSMRWGYILSPSHPLPALRLFPIVVIGYMANDLLPARAGELVRTYVAGTRLSISRSRVLVTIVVERTVDGMTMLAFAGAALLLIPAGPDLQRGLALALVLFLAVAMALFAARRFRSVIFGIAASLVGIAARNIGDRVQTLLSSAMDGLDVLGAPKALGIVFGTSLVAWLCEAAMYALIAQAFGLGLSPAAYLMLVAVANLATLIPASPGYVGTFEAASLAVLVPLLGVPRDLATAYVLVLHVALYFPVTLLGLIYWWQASLSFRAALSSNYAQKERHVN